jgi:hypothetical protein
VRPHIDPFARREIRRPHFIEEHERAETAATSSGQHPRDTEAAEVAGLANDVLDYRHGETPAALAMLIA